MSRSEAPEVAVPRFGGLALTAELGRGAGVAAILACLIAAGPLRSATIVWNGGAGSGAWGTATNWSAGYVPATTDSVVFNADSANGQYAISLGANRTTAGVTFNSATTPSAFTFSGYTLTVNAGGITNNDQLTQTFNSAVTVGSAQTWSATSGGLAFGNVTLSAGLTLSGASSISVTGTLTNSGGSRTITNSSTGIVTFNNINLSNNTTSRTLTITGTGNTAVTGVISNASSSASNLTKSGTGTLTLSGANTYTGTTTINTGTLALGADNTLSNSTAVTVASGATFNVNGHTDTIGSIAGAGGVSLGAGALTAGANNTSTTYSGVMSGSGSLTKTGSGTLTLSGANTYTGATNVNAGTLRLGTNNVLSNSTAVTVASGATLNLNNYSDTVGSLAGAGIITLGSGTLTVGANNASTTFSGSFTSGATGTLAKTGTGTLTFGAGMDLSSGTLQLSGGTLNLGGFTSSFGALNVTADSILDFGTSGSSILNILNSLTVGSGVTLTVANWNDTVDYFYSLTNPGATNLGRIRFTGYSTTDTKWQGYNQEVTPVPEPSTYGAVLMSAVLALAGFRRSRRWLHSEAA